MRTEGSDAGKPVVLVVEDEEFVRTMVIEAIEDAGYSTISAVDADGALRMLDEHDGIDAVFTDIRMPGSVDGLGLAAKVRADHPGMAIILTSGHRYGDGGEVTATLPFLQKPYRATALISTLDSLLR